MVVVVVDVAVVVVVVDVVFVVEVLVDVVEVVVVVLCGAKTRGIAITTAKAPIITTQTITAMTE